MIRLLKQLFIGLLILVIIDRSLGIAMKACGNKVKYGSYKILDEYFNTVNRYDVAIFGNSRGMHQYVPHVFEEKLGVKTINAGMNSTGLSYYKVLVNYCLKRHPAKLIIIDINNRELEDTGLGVGDKYTTLEYLSPFFGKIPEIMELMNFSLREKILYHSNFYRYNTKFYYLIRSCIFGNKIDLQQGYSPYFGKAPRDMRDYRNPVKPIDQERIEALETIISLCKEKNVKLLFVFSPKLNIDDRNYEARLLLTSILTKNKLPYYDYTVDERFKNANLFYDNAHLNNEGAMIFSGILADNIKKNVLTN